MRTILNNVAHGVPSYAAGKWNVAITDMEDAARWIDELRASCPTYGSPHSYGVDGMTPERISNAIRHGDLEMAEASNGFMEAFADMSFNGRKAKIVPAVSGGAPNVAAYLAGSPMAMRRRERVMSDMGALTVFVDGSSSGDVGTEPLKRRGAALLGLVRMLQTVRQVDVYIVGGGVTSDGRTSGKSLTCSVFVKINSAVLDLSRDGFAVAHPAFTRSFLYRASQSLDPIGMPGVLGWEFGGVGTYRQHGLRAFCNALGCDPSQSVFFTPPHSDDPVIDDPIKWIKDMLVRFGGDNVEARA
jgi:hypothetical protein